MKKIGIGIGILALLLLWTSGTCLAQEAKLKITCSKDAIELGDQIEIGISVEDIEMVACELTLNWDASKLELLSQGDTIHAVDHRIRYLWYDKTGTAEPKTGEIVRFRFRSKEAGSVSFLAQGELYDETGTAFVLSSEEIKVEIHKEETILPAEPESEDSQREDNTNLENLAIENTLLYPPFEPAITSYTAEIGNDVTSAKLLAVPEQESATVQIEGNEDWQEGDNQVKIRVTAPSGAKKEYTITVYKRNKQEEAQYVAEQEQMLEKVKQAYEIEKLSTKTTAEEIVPEEKREEPKNTKQWQGILIISIGIGLGVLWYGMEKKKKI